LTPSAAVSAQDLSHSPTWLPLDVQGNALRLVRLDEAAYASASFLDQRLLAMGHATGHCSPATVAAAARSLAPRAHYIFHTGHVGSTLISRLLGTQEQFFALREPALLRAYAVAGAAGEVLPELAAALALLSRTWRQSQRALIKVTSFVSELAVPILAADREAYALLMYTRPLTYLRTILAGPNSRRENQQLTAARRKRLARRLPAWAEDPGGEGESVALSWLCEMMALGEAAQRYPQRVLWTDFDAFLVAPRAGLERMFRALKASPPVAAVEALVSGPLMRQYSKAPEHAYDSALRQAVLASADAEHAAEIRRGLAWLERVAVRHALAAEVLQRSTREDS
jgi:hypothetical protein